MDPLRRPRCECCDEILEELQAMRQNFENYFQRFNKQIVQMRRELGLIMAEKQKVSQSNNHSSIDTNENMPSATGKRTKPDVHDSIARKTTRYERTEDIDDDYDKTENISNGCGAASTSGTRRRSRQSIKSERNIKPSISPSSSVSLNNDLRSPMVTFLGTKLRVMPTCPFKTDVEFEEWEQLLKNDPDQRNRLRRELLQGKFEDPDKFVRHIWRSVLVDEVAQCYTYRGNAKADKKAIKNYKFTAILRECFMQRFTELDAFYFMERTMRIFNYAHDRIRRLSKRQKKIENLQIGVDNSGEQTVAALVKVLNENEEDDINYQGLAPEEDTYEEHNFTDNKYDRPVTINEIKQQREEICNVIAEVLQDKTNVTKSSIEQHKYTLIPEKRGDTVTLFPKTPFKNIEDFKVFEKLIEEDKGKFDELVNQFSQLTGNGSIKFIKVCWRKLLTDAAAQHICWKGTDKKDAIRVLSVTAALKTAYDRKYLEHTDVEFERTCIMFFQYAKTRHEKKQAYQVYQSLSKQSAVSIDHPDV